jgi:uncharacterized lipoprotein NlpE involved in copper resistance
MARDFRIASPCTADWNRMAGDDRVRHCAECNLNVYNFAELTRAEIDDLVATREGRLCARLYRRADGTLITKDCPVGFQMKVSRVSRIAGAALTAAMTAIPLAAAQTPQAAQSTQVHLAPHAANLAVVVTDPSGAPVPNASVTLIDSSTNWKTAQPTNAAGSARLLGLPPGHYKIEVALQGFQTATERINLSAGENVSVETRLGLVLVGEVIEVDNSAHKKHVPKSYFESDEPTSPPESGVRKVLKKLHL